MHKQVSGALLAALLAATMPAAAQPPPLGAAALAQCADYALRLRSESPQLNAQNAQLDQRRAFINQRSAALRAESAQRDRSDLQQGLDLHTRQQAHRREAASFNAEIAQIRREIAAINEIKNRYDQDCSQRPYRRKDLEALTPAQQQAMRAGLDDIEVPYVTPTPASALSAR